jgi:translocation and assembly module TamA
MTYRDRALALGLILLVTACFQQQEPDEPLERSEAPAGDVIAYDVRVEGEMAAELQSLLLAASQAQQLRERPPASDLVLRRRAEDDLAVLQRALHSQGYYDGQVSYELTQAAEGGTRLDLQDVPLLHRPDTHIVYRVVPGPRYEIAGIDVEVENPTDAFRTPTDTELGLKPGDPAIAQSVLDAEQNLLRLTRKQARPLAALGAHTAVIDRDRHTMDVTLRIAPGPRAEFGRITFAGDEGIKELFLGRRLPFTSRAAYDPDLVQQGRDRLVQTNLFSTVVAELGTELDPEGRIPLTYQLRPRLQRSIGGELSYQTDTGPAASAYWEHRNLFNAGERLRTELTVGTQLQDALVSFRKPEIFMPRLALLSEVGANAQDTDAYKSRSLRAGVGFEYEFTEKLIGTFGTSYRYADIDDEGERETFGLLSFPATLDWDFSNDLLDPTRGGRITLSAAPFFDTLGTGGQFLKTQLSHTRYFSLLDEHRLVLALRGNIGSITGASRDEIPADERFYAGGGGSVRGIPFQKAGPLDDKDDPLGGRSVLDFSIEFRSRFTETIGGVVFLDGGTAFDSPFPDFGDELRFGTGVGLRYITPIGPVRFDVGVPIDKRDGIDDAYQIYVSIGQAF